MDQRAKTIKILEENTGRNFYDITFGNDFLDITSKAQATSKKINKVHLIKMKII